MSKISEVQTAMMQALKAKDTPRKEALSMLLSALKAKEKDKKEPLTEAEENAIVQREIKQTKETLEAAPAARTDIRQECEARIKVLSEFAPAAMDDEEVRAIIKAVLEELGLEAPTAKQKGIVMKSLMPRVAGKAEGSVVNRLLGEFLVQ